MTPPIILLVEDEHLILIDIEATLTDAGFEVVTASSGVDALAAFAERSDVIRAVVTDIRLGKGPSGWDIGRHVRQATPTIAVIYMSGDSAADWTSRGVPKSIMLMKPFAGAQMITAISTLLNEQNPSVA